MLRARLAAAALAALTAALLVLPGVASGAQGGDQVLARVAHFAPGLLKGDVYVIYVNGRLQLKGVPFKTVSDHLEVKPGRFEVEVRKAGGVATGAGGTSPDPGPGGRLVLLLLIGGGLAAAAGFAVQQRRSSG